MQYMNETNLAKTYMNMPNAMTYNMRGETDMWPRMADDKHLVAGGFL